MNNTITSLSSYIIGTINDVLVPLVFAIAFAMFLFGIFRFYFLKGADEKSRKEGRGFIIGGIVAFAIMVSVWGLVNLVTGTLPSFINTNQPKPPTFNSAGNGTSGSSQGTASNNTSSQGTASNNTSSQGTAPNSLPGDNGSGSVGPANPNSNNSDYGDLPIQDQTNGLY